MSMSYTYTEAVTFTETHAKHISAKVAADLKRMQRFYGWPSDTHIAQLEAEMIAFLKAGYLDKVTYGFKRDGSWINPTLRYTARELAAGNGNDDDPGRVLPGADVAQAGFSSYMNYSTKWFSLTQAQQDAFENGLPISRTSAPEPGVAGYFVEDRTYSAGGRALDRQSVRSFS